MKLPITNNRQLITKKRAFTLMEVLIAASIFAIVIAIAVGILGQSSSFRGRIQAMRLVSEDTKKIADMISRDVREAGFPAKIELNQIVFEFKSGIMLFEEDKDNTQNPPTSTYTLVNYNSVPSSLDLDGTKDKGAVLVLADKENYNIYHYDKTKKIMCMLTKPRVLQGTSTVVTLKPIENDFSLGNNPNDLCGEFTQLNSSTTDIDFIADGYAPDDSSPIKQQPYIRFQIISETKDYNILAVNQRARMTIQSTVTARSFAD